MYDSLSEFMNNLSADNPLLWALLVMAVVAGTSLILFGFWELVLRLPFARVVSRKNGRRPLRYACFSQSPT